jgi:tetratricopeptide (TPR) repeat protein
LLATKQKATLAQVRESIPIKMMKANSNITLPQIVVLLLLTSLASCRSQPETSAANAPTPTEYLQQAHQLYAQREDLMSIRQGIIALRQARTADPGNYDAAWQQAKFDYYLASHTDNNDERKKAIREGIEAGKAAVKIQDNKPDGHFWLGANYGASAQSGALAGLASMDDIRDEMQKVMSLNEGYQDGSAFMVLGMLYLEAPHIAGGDPEKAVAEMEKGLRYGPGNAFLRLHLAEAYLKVGRAADARAQLNAIVFMKPDQNYLPEYKEASTQARKLLEQAG